MTVAQGPVRTLYTEDDLTLTCTIELNAAVDTGVVVTAVWLGPPGTTMLSTGGRITVSDVTGSRPNYQSTLTVTSLEMSDSGAYTCTATASGNGTTFVTESQAGSHTTTVQSIGKGILSSSLLDGLCMNPYIQLTPPRAHDLPRVSLSVRSLLLCFNLYM